MGDGIDSATDVVISIVMIFTARLINRPPSKKYVFGYEKAEGIATKILSLVIFYAGVQMLLSAIGSIFSNETKEIPSPIAIYVTLFSIAGKLLLASYQYKQGKKIRIVKIFEKKFAKGLTIICFFGIFRLWYKR